MIKRASLLWLLLAAAALAQSIETIPFRVRLSSSNETAAPGVEASGGSTLLLHLMRDASGEIISGSVDFKASYRLATPGIATAMHIHRGAAGSNGPVVIDSGLPAQDSEAASGVLRGQGQIPLSDPKALEAIRGILRDPSGYYLNVHTKASPVGAMRGQLERAESMVVLSQLSSAGGDAKGVAAISICSSWTAEGALSSAEVAFDVNYGGMAEGSAFGRLQIRPALAGAAAAIDSGLTSTPANPAGGNLHYEVSIDQPDAAQAAAISGLKWAPGGFIVDVQTERSPAASMNGKLRATDRAVFQATLLPQNEVPAPQGLAASAGAALTLHTIRNIDGWILAGVAIFDVNYRFPGAVQLTGIHVHDGVEGENGAVILNSGLSGENEPASSSGAGNSYRVVTLSSQKTLAAMEQILARPWTTYLNIHTADYPVGAGRAATGPLLQRPSVDAVLSAVSDPDLGVMAPQGLFTIFGHHLSAAGSNGSGFEWGAPLQLNGTTVTLGGQRAAIVALSTDYIVAQAPVDLAPGRYAVQVSNSGGASAGFEVRIENTAPAVYFDDVGGIAFHSDMTLVRPKSAARPGEEVGLLVTGLGRSAPALATGQAGPAEPPAEVLPPPGVMFGGMSSAVRGAWVYPGTAGYYLVVCTVPEGVSGQVPVTVAAGGAVSNAVTLAVR